MTSLDEKFTAKFPFDINHFARYTLTFLERPAQTTHHLVVA